MWWVGLAGAQPVHVGPGSHLFMGHSLTQHSLIVSLQCFLQLLQPVRRTPQQLRQVLTGAWWGQWLCPVPTLLEGEGVSGLCVGGRGETEACRGAGHRCHTPPGTGEETQASGLSPPHARCTWTPQH